MKNKDKYLKFSIIILNYNGWRDTIECLESIQKIDYPSYEVIIVDNNSTDCSVSMIKKWAKNNLLYREQLNGYNKRLNGHSKEVKEVAMLGEISIGKKVFLIRANENKGFAAGNNIGIKFASYNGSPDFLWLLNNDVIILNKQIFYCLIKYSSKLKNIGVITPLVYGINGEIQKSIARKTPNLAKDLLVYSNIGIFLNKAGLSKIIDGLYYVRFPKNLRSPMEVYAISGSCMLFTSDAIKRIGLLDESTFLFYEEYIVAEKLRKAGLHSYVVPCNAVLHKHGRSTKNFLFRSIRSEIYSYYYFYKVYRRNNLLVVVFFALLRLIDRSLLWLLIYFRNLFLHIKSLFAILRTHL
jgi:GT2 family glycosyltransferase